MKQVQIERRNGLVHIDGYCTNKTVRGAIKELLKVVAKVDREEAEIALNNLEETIDNIDWEMNSRCDYVIQLQEVAGYPIMNDHEEIVDYGEASFYAHIRFVG